MVRTLDLQLRGCGLITGHTLPGLPAFSPHFAADTSILVTFCCLSVAGFRRSFAVDMSILAPSCRRFATVFAAVLLTIWWYFSPSCWRFCLSYMSRLWPYLGRRTCNRAVVGSTTARILACLSPFCCLSVTGCCRSFGGYMSILVAFFVAVLSPFSRSFAVDIPILSPFCCLFVASFCHSFAAYAFIFFTLLFPLCHRFSS